MKASARVLWPGFFLFTALCGAVNAGIAQERVRSIEILGNHALSTNEIFALLGVRSGETVSLPSLRANLERVRSRYREMGYLLARAEANEPSDSSASFIVAIEEDVPAVLRTVNYAGNTALDAEGLNAVAGFSPGDPFVQSNVESGIRSLLEWYERKGLPTARISVADLSMSREDENYAVALRLDVQEGVRAMIEEVRIEGNRITRDNVILRELPLKEGNLFNDEQARTMKRALERLRIFSSVETPEFVLTPENKGALRIRVHEGNPNRFDGMLGYNPAGPGSKGYVSGLVDLRFRNLFGTGRRFSARWMRESQSTQDLGVRYFEPWIAGLPVHVEVGFSQRKQDSTYIRRAYDGELTVNLTDEFTGGLTVSTIEILPGERGLNPVPGASQWSIGGSIQYDTRDHPTTPTQGVVYGTLYEIGRKTIKDGASDQTRRLTFDLEAYLPLTRRQVIACSVHGRDFHSSLLTQSDLFRVGGATTLRGYRENQFQGSRIAWSAIEYRFLTGGESYLYAFTDAGYIQVREQPSAGLAGSDLTRIGYGIGARLGTAVGLVTVGLALGEGDTFRTAKLHFRLVNEF